MTAEKNETMEIMGCARSRNKASVIDQSDDTQTKKNLQARPHSDQPKTKIFTGGQ